MNKRIFIYFVGVFIFVIFSIFMTYVTTKQMYDKEEKKCKQCEICEKCEVCEKCNNECNCNTENVNVEDNEWLKSNLFMAMSANLDEPNPNNTITFDDSMRLYLVCMYALEEEPDPFIVRKSNDDNMETITHFLKRSYANNLSLQLFDKTINSSKVDKVYLSGTDEYGCGFPTGFGVYLPVIKKIYYDKKTNIYTVTYENHIDVKDNLTYELKYKLKDSHMVILSFKKI